MADDELERVSQALDDGSSVGGNLGATVGKAAVSAVLATSLVGALSEPPRTDLMSLPDPVPIVQEYRMDEEVAPPVKEPEADERSVWLRRLLKLLKYLLVALMLAALLLFGVLKGCAGLVGAPMLPHDEEQEEQTLSAAPAEDERGVAY